MSPYFLNKILLVRLSWKFIFKWLLKEFVHLDPEITHELSHFGTKNVMQTFKEFSKILPLVWTRNLGVIFVKTFWFRLIVFFSISKFFISFLDQRLQPFKVGPLWPFLAVLTSLWRAVTFDPRRHETSECRFGISEVQIP